jgi:hypothetical protein
MKLELNFFFWKRSIMFNVGISAIASFFVYVCWINESSPLGAIGWMFVSAYFFMCSLIEGYIQKEKNDADS